MAKNKKKNRNRQQGGMGFETDRQQSQQTGPERRQGDSDNSNRQPRNDRNQQQ